MARTRRRRRPGLGSASGWASRTSPATLTVVNPAGSPSTSEYPVMVRPGAAVAWAIPSSVPAAMRELAT
ncbi:MAG: hypothetical protein ACKOET_10560 [Verrucomicrobiota bacterium]